VEEHSTFVAYAGPARLWWLNMKSFYVLASVIGWHTNVGIVNRHCHKEEIKRRIIKDS
jgi:hypothetical protein